MIIGIVTLENVLEEIIGDVDDEFDERQQDIVSSGSDTWIVNGSIPIEELYKELHIAPIEADVDTFSGLLMHVAERILSSGDRVEIQGFTAEVLETRDDRPVRIRMSRKPADSANRDSSGMAGSNS